MGRHPPTAVRTRGDVEPQPSLMTSSGDDRGRDADPDEQQRFRSLRALTNHWSRPIGRPAYYWYLTFEHSAELQSVASRCQQAIGFPYYDLTPVDELHLTLDR